MLISKIVQHPATAYDNSNGWALQIGEVEKIKGLKINAISSCFLQPQVTAVSGNVATVTFMNSGTTWNSGSLLGGTDFYVIAEGY